MKTRNYLLWVSLLLASVSYGQKVGHLAKNVDFTQFKAFNFMEITFADSLLTPERHKLVGIIKSGVSQELTQRGMKFSPEPDLEINVLITISDHKITRETDFRDIQRGYGTGTSRSYNWQSEEVIVREYKKGEIKLDFVDPKEEALVWQGIIEATRESGDEVEKVEKRVKKNMAKLMKKYPVKPQ